MSTSKWRHELDNYAVDLRQFARHGNLSTTWLDKPDHAAFKVYNSWGYERALVEIDSDWDVDSKDEAEVDGRRIATVFLASGLAIREFSKEIKLLEIMEPKPDKVGNDKVGLDHVEFLVPNLVQVQRHLGRGGVGFEWQSNPSHNSISVPFGGVHEVKFTDTSLADITKAEKQTHER